MNLLPTKKQVAKKSFALSFGLISLCLFSVAINQLYNLVSTEVIGYGLSLSIALLTLSKYMYKSSKKSTDLQNKSFESLDSKVFEFVGVNYMIFHKNGELKRDAVNIKGLSSIYSEDSLMNSFHNVKEDEYLLRTTGEKFFLKKHELNDFNIIEIKEVYKEVIESNQFTYEDLFYEAWVELFSSDLCFKQKVHFSYGQSLDVNIGLEEVENLKKLLRSIYLFTQKMDSVSSVNVSIKSFQENLSIKLKYFDTDSSIEQLKEVNFTSREDSLFQRFYDFETYERGDSSYKVDVSKEESSTKVNTMIGIGISNEFEGLTC